MSENQFKKIDELTKAHLTTDSDLNFLLEPLFPEEKIRQDFIKNCLKKIKTRRMLLRMWWYIEIANDMSMVKNRPALQIVFLVAMTEGVTRLGLDDNSMETKLIIKAFFFNINDEDKDFLLKNIKKSNLSIEHEALTFLEIIEILYDIRNSAIHGSDFYSFSLLDQERKKEYAVDYSDYGIMTSGRLGSRNQKRRVSLDISITYEELRDIFKRTAVNGIQLYL
jgi:hypothetical protein